MRALTWLAAAGSITLGALVGALTIVFGPLFVVRSIDGLCLDAACALVPTHSPWIPIGSFALMAAGLLELVAGAAYARRIARGQARRTDLAVLPIVLAVTVATVVLAISVAGELVAVGA